MTQRLINEDWTKRTWDLGVDTLDGLFWFLAPGPTFSEREKALRHLMSLPVWKAAPEQLKESVASYLGDKKGGANE